MITKTYEITISADSIDDEKFMLYLKETICNLDRYIENLRNNVKVREADVDDGR
jgi:hypothetical protein